MILSEQAHEVAVALAKGENMRTTAGVKFADMVEYVYTPGTDGAQQVIEAGFEPTQVGCWKMVTVDDAYPTTLGISWSAGKKQLRIGRAPDPAKADADERAKERTYDRAPRYTTDRNPVQNVTEPELWTGIPKEKAPGAPLPPADRPHVQHFLAQWHGLHPDEQAYVLPHLKPMRF